ncbi:keratin-associated protein 13-1-like [Equus caballus]|uniref:keratin-associated protein 13-1-like n=1 Tax=Equus caballus TaxID=9796 RepID=UPI0038B2BCC0
MSHSCCSGSFSSRSLGGYLSYPGSFCGSSYPRNLFYSTASRSPITCQLGSSLYSGCQENYCEPIRCQPSYVVSRPCQTSCYHPRTSTLCSPCLTTYSGSLGFGSSSSCSPRCGFRSSYSLGCGSSSFRPLVYGVRGFPSLSYGSGFCRPSYLTSRNFQSSCYRPTCGSGFY